MDELDDILDEGKSNDPKQVPEGVKVMAIFSMIGNGFWSFVMLIGILAILFWSSVFDKILPKAFDGIIAILVVICLLITALHVVGLIAAVKMRQGSKKAFATYTVVTGIWVALLVLSAINPGSTQDPTGTWVCAVVSLGFIIGFGVQMKNMPD